MADTIGLAPQSRDLPPRRDWFSARTFGMVIASVAAVWSTTLIASAWRATRRPPPAPPHVLASTGTMQQHATPDHIHWQVTVSSRAKDCAAALRALVVEVARTRDFLTANGATTGEVSTYPLTVEPETDTVTHHHPDGSDDTTEVPHGFLATQHLELDSSDVPRMLGVFRAVVSSTALGDIDVPEPTCTTTQRDRIHEVALAGARFAVRARAITALAQLGSSRLGRLVGDPTPPSLGAMSSPLAAQDNEAQVQLGRSNGLGRLTSLDIGSVVDGFGQASLATCEHGTDVIATATATYEIE